MKGIFFSAFPLWRAVACVCLLCAGERSEAAERVFEVRGIVRGPVAQGTLLIEHEDIDGFMPAMTMPFYLGEEEPQVEVAVGDAVRFRFIVGDASSRAEGFEVLRRASGAGEAANDAGAEAAGREGELIPRVELVDEVGDRIRFEDFEGRYTVVTFIFTRCPVPEFCPLLSSKFGLLQSQLDGRKERRFMDTRLLSVSLDPGYDSPEVLAGYGARVGANGKRWRFGTGEASEIERLAAFAGLRFSGEGTGISHDLRTLLVGPDGRLVNVWSGNRWKADEVLEAIAASGGPE